MTHSVGILVRAMNGAQKLHRIKVPDSGWSEHWSPDPNLLDVWAAVHVGRGGVTFEIEVSRSSVVIGEHIGHDVIEIESIDLLGMVNTATIPVKRVFPAGRALCFRVGAHLPLVRDWGAARTQYGPLLAPLPSVDSNHWQAIYEQRLRALAQAQQNQTSFHNEDTFDGICEPWIGPWAFWGQRDPGPGAPGGSGITHATGYQACPAFAAFACEASAIAMQRMFFAYKRRDGTPVCVEDYGEHSPNYDTESFDGFQLPEFMGIPRDDFPPPQALTHASRVFRWLIAAAELTGSRMARRHIRLFFEQMRLQFSDTCLPQVAPEWTTRQMSSKLQLAAAKRNAGAAGLGRREGWCAWIAAEYIKLFGTNPGVNRWRSAFLRLFNINVMPNGCSNAHEEPELWGPVGTKSTAVFEEALLGIGMTALCKQSDTPVGIGNAYPALAAAVSLYLENTMPKGSYHGGTGPLHFAHVVIDGVVQQQLTSGKGYDPANPGDPGHVEAFCAAAGIVTHDPVWADASLEYGIKAWDVAGKIQTMLNHQHDEFEMNQTALLLGWLQASGS